jgi:cytochrome c553
METDLKLQCRWHCFKWFVNGRAKNMTSFLHEIPCMLGRVARFIMLALAMGFAGAAVASGPLVGDLAAGKDKNSMCIGCHGIPGYKASFPEVYAVPMIAGQNEQYLVVALRAYATGERTHPTMTAISSTLSEQDMADLAAYYANLK